ncbi:MAG TPA: P-type conjugative transfer protein TrbG [Acidothermaceae bacterium]
MHNRSSILFVAATIGCASRQPPPQYVRATPEKDPPRQPVVVEVPQPMPMPGQLRRIPVHDVKRPEKQSPSDVIADANRKAALGPDREGYFNAIMTYDFADGALYQVYAAPLRLTTIELQPGEKIVGRPAAGDTVRWIMDVGRSGTGPAEQEHLYIKPTRSALSTTMVVTTDRRTYYLELHSFEDTYVAAVRWRYPQDDIAQLQAGAAREDALARSTTATNVNVDALNFNYRIGVEKGRPTWVPLQVFDDNHKTFIRFPATMLNRDAPALFVVSSANEAQIVNYRVKNDYYVVDRLFERAELRVGQQEQEIVQIVRSR